MNRKFYTNYPQEEEILLDDGRPFLITKVERDKKVTAISSTYHKLRALIPIESNYLTDEQRDK